jgi:hypothetical protein
MSPQAPVKGVRAADWSRRASPLFITGHPKSGTSLVASMLDGHPDLLVIPEESDAVSMFVGAIRQPAFHFGTVERRTEIVVDLFRHISHLRNLFRGRVDDDIGGNFDYSDFDTEIFVSELRARLAELGQGLSGSFRAIAQAYGAAAGHLLADGRGAGYWVEKSPAHAAHVCLLARLFPDAKFIHVVRDPRDNWLSYKKKHPDLDAVHYGLRWAMTQRRAESFRRKWPERMKFVKYEELVADPRREAEAIAAFLGVRYHDNLLTPSKFGKPWLGNSMWDRSTGSISASAVGRYRERISPKDHAALERIVGPWLDSLGYGRDLQARAMAPSMLLPRSGMVAIDCLRHLRMRLLGYWYLK